MCWQGAWSERRQRSQRQRMCQRQRQHAQVQRLRTGQRRRQRFGMGARPRLQPPARQDGCSQEARKVALWAVADVAAVSARLCAGFRAEAFGQATAAGSRAGPGRGASSTRAAGTPRRTKVHARTSRGRPSLCYLAMATTTTTTTTMMAAAAAASAAGSKAETGPTRGRRRPRGWPRETCARAGRSRQAWRRPGRVVS